MTSPPNPSWPPEPGRDAPGSSTPPAAIPAAQPPNYPGGYGHPGYPGPAMAIPTNEMAIASLVLGILWVAWIGSILALIFGYVARRQIRERHQGGDGLAIAGIVLGWVGLGMLGFYVIFIIVAVIAAST